VNSAIDYPFEYSHVTAAKLVHTGSCVLHTVVINSNDTSGPLYATIYDGTNAGGTAIAVIDVDAGKTYYVLPVTLLYDVKMTTGIYVGFSAETNTADLTVTFK